MKTLFATQDTESTCFCWLSSLISSSLRSEVRCFYSKLDSATILIVDAFKRWIWNRPNSSLVRITNPLQVHPVSGILVAISHLDKMQKPFTLVVAAMALALPSARATYVTCGVTAGSTPGNCGSAFSEAAITTWVGDHNVNSVHYGTCGDDMLPGVNNQQPDSQGVSVYSQYNGFLQLDWYCSYQGSVHKMSKMLAKDQKQCYNAMGQDFAGRCFQGGVGFNV